MTWGLVRESDNGRLLILAVKCGSAVQAACQLSGNADRGYLEGPMDHLLMTSLGWVDWNWVAGDVMDGQRLIQASGCA